MVMSVEAQAEVEGSLEEEEQTSSAEEADPPPDPNRFELAPFPVIGGNTDVGFKFGFNLALARLEEGYRPYRYRLNAVVALSVKSSPDGGAELPEHDYMVSLDFPGLAGGRLRVFVQAGFQRVINAGYYGLDGWSSPDPLGRRDLGGGRAFQYVRQMPVANVDFRLRLGELPLELLFGAHYRFLLPNTYAESLLNYDMQQRYSDGTEVVIGANQHSLALLRFGVSWDGRDHEIAPTRGIYAELSGRLGLGIPRDDDNFFFGAALFDLRFFAPLLADQRLVLAGRFLVDLQLGEVPYYFLREVGTFYRHGFCGSNGIRGCPEGRRAGELKMLGALELRSLFLPFTLFRTRMIFGMALNITVGQSMTRLHHDAPFVDAGPAATWGAGYALLLRWGEAVMVRIEVDYSPDAADAGTPVGFYMELGHAF